MIKAVVFDWAGTMIDFGSRAPVDALCAAFAQAGVPITPELARRDMGRAKRDHVETIIMSPEVVIAWQSVHNRHPSSADADAIYVALEPLMAEAASQHTTMILGAAELVVDLRSQGIKIGSCTGYTRAMMSDILPHAAAQGYVPDALVCAGETLQGRPSPLMLWKNLVELGIWPAESCVKVDDAEVGIEEGLNAGCWSVGVAASGNAVGLGYDAFMALSEANKRAHTERAANQLTRAGAHYVITTVADLPSVLTQIEQRLRGGERP